MLLVQSNLCIIIICIYSALQDLLLIMPIIQMKFSRCCFSYNLFLVVHTVNTFYSFYAILSQISRDKQ